MNKKYYGNYAATILSYDGDARTAMVNIPSVTDGLSGGIKATFAYPVGDDDKDTERQILDDTDCYIFFQSGEPSSPVVFAFRSHGVGAVVDHRRIRQANIELLASAKITLEAANEINLNARTVRINAENLIITAKTEQKGDFGVEGATVLEKTTIEGRDFGEHGHKKVKSGDDNSGGVV